MDDKTRDIFRTLATTKAELIASILAPAEDVSDDDKVQEVMSGMCAIFMVLDLATDAIEGDERREQLKGQVEALSDAFIKATSTPAETDDDQS